MSSAVNHRGGWRMAGKKNELTFVVYMILENGEVIPFEDMTAEQTKTWQKNMCSRLSENMSDYYPQHPDQYARLCRELESRGGGHQG